MRWSSARCKACLRFRRHARRRRMAGAAMARRVPDGPGRDRRRCAARLRSCAIRDTSPAACAERCDGIAPLRGATGPVDMIAGRRQHHLSAAPASKTLRQALFRSGLRAVRRRGSRLLRAACAARAAASPGRMRRACMPGCRPSRAKLCLGPDARLSRRQFRHARVAQAQPHRARTARARWPKSRARSCCRRCCSSSSALRRIARRMHCAGCSGRRASSRRCSAARYNEYAVIHGE